MRIGSTPAHRPPAVMSSASSLGGPVDLHAGLREVDGQQGGGGKLAAVRGRAWSQDPGELLGDGAQGGQPFRGSVTRRATA